MTVGLFFCLQGENSKMAKMRMDKCLADAGYGTRKNVKDLIRSGQVKINDRVCLRAEDKVDPLADNVYVQGNRVLYESFSYYMMNKPQGVVSATKDLKEKTVVSLITDYKRRDLFPVGRLDKDTEGLLLITNDGKLANDLLAPGKHVKKTYFAKIRGMVTQKEVEIFAQGIDIGDDKPTLPAQMYVKKNGVDSEIEITITEGRYHQIKRMFEAVGMQVLYLKRIQMGSLRLDENLACGAYRKLTEAEIRALKRRGNC